MITFNPDKFGYYEVGSFKTYSKIEAIQKSNEKNIPFKWNFNEEVFSSIDWSIEPDIDVWELYKQRARQIREAYDYVVLFYSGGSDSHNLLLAWIEAGCKIDEIASTWGYEGSGEKYDHHNAETTHVIFPDIKKLQDSGFDFKFRLIDLSEYCVNIFDDWSSNYEYNVNFHLSPNNPARHLFRDKIQDYKDIINSGKKLVFVWGKEKPIIKNNKFCFADNIDNCVGPYVQRKYNEGWYDELFYWTPDFPIIPVKQYHIIMNFLKLSDDKNLFEISKNKNGYSEKFKMSIKDEVIKSLLYPKWSNDIFCNGKAHSMVFSERDRWFLNSNIENKKNYLKIVTFMTNILPEKRKKLIIGSSYKGGFYPIYSGEYGTL